MATTINTIIRLDDYPLTSQIGNIPILTDNQSETVSLSHYGDDGDVLFTTALFAFDNKVTLYDISSVIEEDMRKNGKSVGDYTLAVGTASIRIRPVYCDYMAAGINVKENFLTTLHSQRAYPDSLFEINAIPNQETATFLCLYRKSDGNIGTITIPIPGQPFSSGSLHGSFPGIRETVESVVGSDVELVAVTASNGNRSKTYYLIQGIPDVVFYFRNCFNAFEFVNLKGLLTGKTSMQSSMAVSSGISSQYDRSVIQTFDFQSEPLTEQEARSIAQLVTSHEIYVVKNGEYERILVTDSTCDIDNDDSSLWSVKITWRYLDSRPHFSTGQISDMAMPGSIFTNEFTEQFL